MIGAVLRSTRVDENVKCTSTASNASSTRGGDSGLGTDNESDSCHLPFPSVGQFVAGMTPETQTGVMLQEHLPEVASCVPSVLDWKSREAQRVFALDMQPRYQEHLICPHVRAEACDWVLAAAKLLRLPVNASFLAMSIFDRWVGRIAVSHLVSGVPTQGLTCAQTRGITAVSLGLALKLSTADDARVFSTFGAVRKITDGALSVDELKSLEMTAVHMLNYEVEMPTSFDFFAAVGLRAQRLFMKHQGQGDHTDLCWDAPLDRILEPPEEGADVAAVEAPFVQLGLYYLHICLQDLDLQLRYSAPVLAGACLVLALQCMTQELPNWADYMALVMEDLALTIAPPQAEVKVNSNTSGDVPLHERAAETYLQEDKVFASIAHAQMAVARRVHAAGLGLPTDASQALAEAHGSLVKVVNAQLLTTFATVRRWSARCEQSWEQPLEVGVDMCQHAASPWTVNSSPSPSPPASPLARSMGSCHLTRQPWPAPSDVTHVGSPLSEQHVLDTTYAQSYVSSPPQHQGGGVVCEPYPSSLALVDGQDGLNTLELQMLVGLQLLATGSMAGSTARAAAVQLCAQSGPHPYHTDLSQVLASAFGSGASPNPQLVAAIVSAASSPRPLVHGQSVSPIAESLQELSMLHSLHSLSAPPPPSIAQPVVAVLASPAAPSAAPPVALGLAGGVTMSGSTSTTSTGGSVVPAASAGSSMTSASP